MISSDKSLGEITASLVRTVSPKVLPRRMAAIAVQIMRLLANGRPVSPEQLGEVWSLQQEDTVEIVRQFQTMGLAELDEKGKIVGMVLSLRPTAHRFHINGRELFTWCAVDTLFLPALLQQEADVESNCPTTGKQIHLRVNSNELAEIEPVGAVLSLLAPGCTVGISANCGPELVGSQGSFCKNVLFFSSEKASSLWLAEHPGAVILPVKEAFDLARNVWALPFLSSLQELSP